MWTPVRDQHKVWEVQSCILKLQRPHRPFVMGSCSLLEAQSCIPFMMDNRTSLTWLCYAVQWMQNPTAHPHSQSSVKPLALGILNGRKWHNTGVSSQASSILHHFCQPHKSSGELCHWGKAPSTGLSSSRSSSKGDNLQVWGICCEMTLPPLWWGKGFCLSNGINLK